PGSGSNSRTVFSSFLDLRSRPPSKIRPNIREGLYMVTVLRTRGDRSIRSYIDAERGTISREIYVNPDIFEQEMEQIFQRCWLFLGHESQLPNPGDFVISRMGTEEVILVRDRKDHQIRAFLNSCRHRGMKGCRYD